ncbi:hypothetical protein HPB48_007742 [Haemaphysalis longicornis]|uniref:Oxysterol-binding protein n=1 Tax=Haemaphysalis longicornis TaxID=44386 RepID=A0A9J6G490_HAELO|nr:hypothetical protein HPB48_007742 [Haemaphysalis longicornis]
MARRRWRASVPGSMEGQKSVFSHLLSQVYIGMDLTKVTLPTFILERRSLLEMYADFFAHPELFVSIVDRRDAKERMVEVVRWYLSAFHAGRKSAVAKKPYNPILGEIFRCYWRIGDKPGAPVPDGPVPWATTNDLAFIAEQVSHHPPVSAFYAEHAGKGICCGAHIWTKSKFLGMSIGVHNVGMGVIQFLKHDEQYTVTFPSGYGRSIFTVPWIELGGTVDINCEKTGYSCTIQFHTKPMIGGKKHQLTAEIFPPNDKRPFLTVEGEWNGVMTAKNIHGTEVTFVDTTTLPTTKKVVRLIKDQEPHESRRLWKDVTLSLKRKDVDRATEFKSQLEDQQRKDAAQRKEAKQTWNTRVNAKKKKKEVNDRVEDNRFAVKCTATTLLLVACWTQVFEAQGTAEETRWVYKSPLFKRALTAKRTIGGKDPNTTTAT